MNKLFDTSLPALHWLQFEAHGFTQPVSGVIYHLDRPPCCGVPLGGISTGCLDIDARGVFGYCSIFNEGSDHLTHPGWRMPRKYPRPEPILGLSVEGQTWVLAAQELIQGGEIPWCTDPDMAEMRGQEAVVKNVPCPKLEDVQPVRDIQYWGHFPVVDMEFETGAPVSVGMRAWASLIPGDTAVSNIPAAVFEVHLRNTSERLQKGAIALNFPGPQPREARGVEFSRELLSEDFTGVYVYSVSGVGYVLGVMGSQTARFGAGLCAEPKAWSKIASELPQTTFRESQGLKLYLDASCSAAVDFALAAGEEKMVKFLLTWYAPVWEGNTKKHLKLREGGVHPYHWIGSEWEGDAHFYTHMYATRYGSAIDVARRIVMEQESLHQRILKWQSVIYADEHLTVWLRDSLVNNLALITEDSYWAQPKPPLGDWAYPNGVFGLIESPRGCPDVSNIPCDWYGNLPVVFFYPELARTTLRSYKAFQKDNGEIPFILGLVGDFVEFAVPAYHWQVSLNGMCYVDLVDRLWQRSGNNAVLKEFYESVKQCNTFTMQLKKGPGGVISMPEEGGMEWFEFGEWAGMVAHVGGLRLAELRIMIRMAEAMGDTAYVQQCQEWLADGQRAMEEEMWTGSYYLNFYEKETGKKSDVVMAYQLDGEWTARYHGLPGVYRADRVKTALDTIQRVNMALAPEIGAINFATVDGSPLPVGNKVAEYGRFSMFPPEVVVLGMTYIYSGDEEIGLDLLRRHWENLVLRQRHPWDLPNIVRGDTGKRIFGTDYYQNMMLWAVPAALAHEDIMQSCRQGGLIEAIIRAGKVSN